jgi:NAD(P)-dependent dehydrogenase (short-subunit alcohol dehydrogenase family)
MTAMQRLAGQVAIVTGGAQGIGGATARRLAEEGARVLVVDVDGGLAQSNVDRIRDGGGEAEPLVADVGSAESIQAMIDLAIQRWGQLNIVVSNAFSPVLRGDVASTTDEIWDRAMDVGLKSMFRAARAATPHLRRAGGGSLINMSSVHGLLMAPGSHVYEVIKSAVIGLTRQLATELGPDNIRANAICPGHIVTERIATGMWEGHADGLRYFAEQYPLRRTGVPVDIANAIVFLCSDEASFITGQALVVDGGLSIQLQENLAIRMAHYQREHPDVYLPY